MGSMRCHRLLVAVVVMLLLRRRRVLRVRLGVTPVAVVVNRALRRTLRHWLTAKVHGAELQPLLVLLRLRRWRRRRRSAVDGVAAELQLAHLSAPLLPLGWLALVRMGDEAVRVLRFVVERGHAVGWGTTRAASAAVGLVGRAHCIEQLLRTDRGAAHRLGLRLLRVLLLLLRVLTLLLLLPRV
jgi:hypothetical protein